MPRETTTCSNRIESQPAATAFHLSLNVADLEESIAFFRAFFGREPAKCREDYAKFELADPPLTLSLEPCRVSPGGNLNHLGFRMPDAAALVDVQRRLETVGISTQREEGVECCYARQTKFWVHDPDGNLWEVYTLDEDLEHRGSGQLPVVAAKDTEQVDVPAASIWEHRLGDKFPARLPILDRTVDRVQLEGTFNERLAHEEQLQRLAEVRRILKPGGSIHLHMLTADRDLGEEPLQLPGPAARVEFVPAEPAMLADLHGAGFSSARTVLRAERPCFKVGQCELRETRIEATVD